jgi:hypothetical protein
MATFRLFGAYVTYEMLRNVESGKQIAATEMRETKE